MFQLFERPQMHGMAVRAVCYVLQLREPLASLCCFATLTPWNIFPMLCHLLGGSILRVTFLRFWYGSELQRLNGTVIQGSERNRKCSVPAPLVCAHVCGGQQPSGLSSSVISTRVSETTFLIEPGACLLATMAARVSWFFCLDSACTPSAWICMWASETKLRSSCLGSENFTTSNSPGSFKANIIKCIAKHLNPRPVSLHVSLSGSPHRLMLSQSLDLG